MTDSGLQLKFLDSTMNICGLIQPINTQWSRKYYEVGSFSIEIPTSQFVSDAKYVYSSVRSELGVIMQYNYTQNKGVQSLQISGLFIENELNDKIIYPQYSTTKNLEDGVVNIVNTYKEDIPLLNVSTSQGRGSSTEFLSCGDSIGTYIQELLKSNELGYKIVYDYDSNKKIFSVYEGKDRTSERTNTLINPIIFSTSFKNLLDVDVVQSNENYKNYAIVYGDIGDDEKAFVTVDLSNGQYKKKVYLDAGESWDNTELTLAQYKNKLYTIGTTKLLNDYCMTTNVQGSAVSTSYEYLVDYDLGDKVDIVIVECGIEMTARIIAIYEVIKNGEHEITLEFGNPIVKKGGRL